MSRMMQVDRNRCTGCGRCLEACPTGAIRLADGVATVEASLCRGCQACLEACPTGAIFAVEEVTGSVPAPASAPTPAPAPLRVPAPARPAAGLRPAAGILPVVGAALAFVGREIVPRVVATLLERQERWRTESAIARAARRPAGSGRRYRWRLRRRGHL